jgi:hypothetical protein
MEQLGSISADAGASTLRFERRLGTRPRARLGGADRARAAGRMACCSSRRAGRRRLDRARLRRGRQGARDDHRLGSAPRALLRVGVHRRGALACPLAAHVGRRRACDRADARAHAARVRRRPRLRRRLARPPRPAGHPPRRWQRRLVVAVRRASALLRSPRRRPLTRAVTSSSSPAAWAWSPRTARRRRPGRRCSCDRRPSAREGVAAAR